MQSIPPAAVRASRFPRWARNTLALMLLVAVTIGVPWCLINAMGRHAWGETQALFKREGETLEFRALLSPVLPEERNFCASPRLLGLAAPPGRPGPHAEEGRRNREAIERTSVERMGGAAPSGLRTGERFSVEQTTGKKSSHGGRVSAEQSEEAMRQMQEAVAKAEPLLAELATRLDCSEAQWDPPLATVDLPEPLYLLTSGEDTSMGRLVTLLRRRAAIACREGNARRAVECVQMLLRLCKAEADKPLEYGTQYALGTALDIVWQMSDERQGTMELWQLMEAELASCEVQAWTLRSCRGAVAFEVELLLYGREHGLPDFASFPRSAPTPLSRVLPDGIYLNNASAFAEVYLENVLRPLRSGTWADALRGCSEVERIVHEGEMHPWRNISTFWVRLEGRSHIDAVRGSAYRQSILNQALVACALEQYRLARGGYPESLLTLTLANGAPLPKDPIAGKPIGYRRVGEERYVLWCVGISGVDHGGTRSSRPQMYMSDGDWVWGFESGAGK